MKYTEKDLEDYLYKYPEEIGVDKWIGRQFRLPSGVADLVGICGIKEEEARPCVIVVELKKGVLNPNAIAQVSRYANDMRSVISTLLLYDERITDYFAEYNPESRLVVPCIVSLGRAEKKPCKEALGAGISLFSYEVHQTTNDLYFTFHSGNYKESYEERSGYRENISEIIKHSGIKEFANLAASYLRSKHYTG